jgi:hypothetical protein
MLVLKKLLGDEELTISSLCRKRMNVLTKLLGNEECIKTDKLYPNFV